MLHESGSPSGSPEDRAMKRLVLAGGLFAALFFAGSEARAQTGSARGRVVDEQGQPIADAKVELDFQGGVNRKLETKTNKKGEYIQVGLQPGALQSHGLQRGLPAELRRGEGQPRGADEHSGRQAHDGEGRRGRRRRRRAAAALRSCRRSSRPQRTSSGPASSTRPRLPSTTSWRRRRRCRRPTTTWA